MPSIHSSLAFLVRGLAAASFLLLSQTAANAGTLYIARLNAANENPPTTSTDTGTGVVILNDAETQATVTATHTITVPVTGGHIHRGATGVNGPVIFPFAAPTSPVGPLTWAIPAADVDNLKNLGLYFNFHTAASPGGAIRGQIFRARLAPAAANAPQTALANVLDLSAGYDADLDRVLIQTNFANTATQAQTLGELTPTTLHANGRQQLEAMISVAEGLFGYASDVRTTSGMSAGNLNVFLKGGDGFGRRSATDNQTGSTISRPFAVIGFDHPIGTGARGGLAVSYAHGRDAFRGGMGKTISQTTGLHTFASIPLLGAGLVLDGTAGYGWTRIDSTRRLASLGRVANARPDGNVWAGALKLSKSVASSSQTMWIPYAMIDVQKGTVETYTETGADAVNLMVSERKTWNSAVEAGTAVLFPLKAKSRVNVRLAAGWRHLLEDGSDTFTTRISGSPIGFGTRIEGPGKNSAHVEAALNAMLTNGVLGTLSYRGSLGADDQTTHAIEGRLIMKF